MGREENNHRHNTDNNCPLHRETSEKALSTHHMGKNKDQAQQV